ncbi:hypothetical protein M408DRAFT_271487 [Serendipita vermifera MAFF 305830]|uniref:Uncharacterized protein n=1 Tax=Serendipita vermifera MAFF 305830 TaxID=933852 RepID=A0A0C2WXJ0_SERVB|nr:hypothetical protein M408DRAFT_271487 [Serendipita vermifera MAFF 305830]
MRFPEVGILSQKKKCQNNAKRLRRWRRSYYSLPKLNSCILLCGSGYPRAEVRLTIVY